MKVKIAQVTGKLARNKDGDEIKVVDVVMVSQDNQRVIMQGVPRAKVGKIEEGDFREFKFDLLEIAEPEKIA